MVPLLLMNIQATKSVRFTWKRFFPDTYPAGIWITSLFIDSTWFLMVLANTSFKKDYRYLE